MNFGYWVFGKDMNNVKLETLKNNGVTDLFLNYYAFTANGKTNVVNWIKKAKADHTHPKSTIYAESGHTHGNITSDGKVGSSADYFVYTTTSGKVTSKQKIGNITTAGAIGSTASKPIITTTSGVLTTGSFGTTSGTFCQGNDSRLHSHTFTYSGGRLTIT